MRSLGYSIKQGFQQIFRNRGTSVTATLLITLMLVLVGICFVISSNLNLFSEIVKDDYNEVEVFLLDDISNSEINDMLKDIRGKNGVLTASYRTKEDALNTLKERWGENGYLLDTLGENPLPASIVITVTSLDYSGEIAEYCGTLDKTDDVQFYQQTVEVLSQVTNSVQNISYIMMAFFVIISIFLIQNTVKLTVMARQDEIQIMKYIGATNWFVRGPFMIEGMLIGFIASLIATGVIGFSYYELIKIYGPTILSITQSSLLPVEFITINAGIIFVSIGLSIGAWGSLVSIKRFLRA